MSPLSNLYDLVGWMTAATVHVNVIEAVGHNFMIEDPIEVNKLIYGFLKVNKLV